MSLGGIQPFTEASFLLVNLVNKSELLYTEYKGNLGE